MIGFDSVKTKLESNDSLSFSEFNYMIMQAYDFHEFFRKMGCRIQFGGRDQWGNIVNGVELIKKKLGEEAFGFTCPLLTTSDGRKMGKTANGAVWLSNEMFSVYDFWQYWRNINDADVIKCMYLFTDIDLAEIKKMESIKGEEINDLKKILANEITSLVHGKDSLEAVHRSAKNMFGGNGADLSGSDSIQKYEISKNAISDKSLTDILTESKLCESRGDAKRLLRGNGVCVNDKIVGEEYQLVAEDFSDGKYLKISVGKKKHLLAVIKN
jgi:tyrosyl-tRNA synthetase